MVVPALTYRLRDIWGADTPASGTADKYSNLSARNSRGPSSGPSLTQPLGHAPLTCGVVWMSHLMMGVVGRLKDHARAPRGDDSGVSRGLAERRSRAPLAAMLPRRCASVRGGEGLAEGLPSPAESLAHESCQQDGRFVVPALTYRMQDMSCIDVPIFGDSR